MTRIDRMGLFNAKQERWCPDCNEWFEVNKPGLVPCPRCLKVPRVGKCNRCGGEWSIRMAKYPNTCPKCKSPYFNHKRIQDRKN